MSGYTALDHGFPENQKVMALHDRSFRFHIIALDYCSRNMTDGHLSARAVKVLAAILETTSKRWTAELVQSGLWKHDEAGDGFWINDYLKHNPSGSSMKKLRDVRRSAGLKGAEKRWGITDGSPDPTPDENGKGHGTSHGKGHGKEQIAAEQSREELEDPGRLLETQGLPIKNELLTARLLGVIGDHADAGTRSVVRKYADQLPESSVAKVLESLQMNHPDNRAAYVVGALKAEIEERAA